MKVWAIIPAKCFDRAKSRLSPVLSESERHDLAAEMFDHVVRVATGTSCLQGVLVVTDCDEVTIAAQKLGVQTAPDREGGLAASLDAALTLPDADAAIILMADLPKLIAGDIEALVEKLTDSESVIAPDRQHEGTNALGLRLPAATPTAFGRYGSFDEHLRRLREPAIVERDGLAFDVDAPEDLALFKRAV